MRTKNKDILYVKEIVNKFGLDVLYGEGELNSRQITATGVTRPGFELTGVFIYPTLLDVCYFGSKEDNYLVNFSPAEIATKISSVIKLDPPCILIGKNFSYTDIMLEVAKGYQVPILSCNSSLYELNFTVFNYISERLSPSTMVHGSLVSIFGLGVLILGDSGVGKSEVTIELVKKGHIFIGDDAIKIIRAGSRLLGESEPITQDFIEVRGLGILNFSRVFGTEKIVESTDISIVVILKKVDGNPKNFERLGEFQRKYELMNVELPCYEIPVVQGRNVAEIIETAVTDHKLRMRGYNSAKAFMRQTKNNLNNIVNNNANNSQNVNQTNNNKEQ